MWWVRIESSEDGDELEAAINVQIYLKTYLIN